MNCCSGNPRDAAIVDTVVDVLMRSGQTPLKKNAREVELQQMHDIAQAYLTSGRYSGWFEGASREEIIQHATPDIWLESDAAPHLSPRMFRQARSAALARSLPAELPPDLMEVVMKELSGNQVHAPPMTVKLDRKKKAATSSKQDYLKDWLESADGKAWRAEREQMFGEA